MSRKIYFAAVEFSSDEYVRENFTDEESRERWIARHIRGDVYENATVVSVARAEGEWVDAPALATTPER
jgi:hypothetical protein